MTDNSALLNQGPSSPFRDNQNRRLIRGLFYEWDKNSAMYTLKDQDLVVDGRIYPSLSQLYLRTQDVTEYEFARTYLESWEHWLLLTESSFLMEHISRWRTELELQLKATFFREILKAAKEGKYDAQKFLATKGWIEKKAEPARRGRPSKAEITQNALEIATSSKQIEEDFKRMQKDLN